MRSDNTKDKAGSLSNAGQIQKNSDLFRVLVEEAPVGTCLFTGREMKVEIINNIMIGYWGKGNTVLGKPLIEALPELKGQPFLKLLDDVYTTGKTYVAKDTLVELEVDGVKGQYYYDFTYKPVRNPEGEIFGIINVSINATERVHAQQKLENSQKDLLSYFENSPVAIAIIDKEDLTFRMANPFYGELVDRTPEELVDKPLLEALPELRGQGFDDLLNGVIKTGTPFIANEVAADLKRKGVLEKIYVNLQYQPQKSKDGTISGIFVVATDVTQQVVSRKKIEESESSVRASEARFRGLIMDAPVATCVFVGEDLRLELANEMMLHLWNKDSSIVGMRLKDALHDLNVDPVIKVLNEVYASGKPHSQNGAKRELIINGVSQTRYFNLTYKPLFKESGEVYGIMDMAVDVTDQIVIQKQIEESELFSKDVFYSSPVAKIVFTGMDMIVARVNENMLNILGRDNSIIGKPFMDAMPELLNTPILDRMQEVYTTGVVFNMPEEQIKLIRHGKAYTGYYSYIYKPLKSASGDIYGIICTANEVTDQVDARKLVEAKEKEWRDLIASSPIGICIVSGNPAWVEEVNERFLVISGKTREQYGNASYWEVLHEAAPFFEKVLDDVFKTGKKFTTEETEVMLLRNNITESVFLTFEYIPVLDNNHKVTKVIIMAIEVTHQVETRKQIEEAVINRTKELAETNLSLKRSNEELEQFAYIASHDLQEPIRKISTFTQLLEHSIEKPGEKTKDYIAKIFSSTDRMTNLVRDVLAFSRVKGEKNVFEKVDLKEILDTVRADFEVKIEQTNAKLEVSGLPTVDAVASQMNQLFSNLISNSLKYRKVNTSPVIKITAGIASEEKVKKRMALDPKKKYYHIEYSDNGIGFHEDQVERIFKIFQRLHGKTEFEGTGIGLAICLRIVHNHNGHISAAVGQNGGAVFNILLPQIYEEAVNAAE